MKTLKTEIKKQRLAILEEIDKQEPLRCDSCKGYAISKEILMCKCPAAVEIRNLGKQMDALVRKRKPAYINTEQNRYDPKLVKLAKENGIEYQTFQRRVQRYGYSELRAATEPLVRRRKKA